MRTQTITVSILHMHTHITIYAQTTEKVISVNILNDFNKLVLYLIILQTTTYN